MPPPSPQLCFALPLLLLLHLAARNCNASAGSVSTQPLLLLRSASTAQAAVTPSDAAEGGHGEFVFVIVFFCVGLVGFIVLVAYCTRYASSKSDRRAERYLSEVQERRRISQENAYKLNAALLQQSMPQLVTVDQCSPH